MSCEKYDLLISAYIDGEVSSEEKKILEQHIKECKECNIKMKELQEMSGLIKQELNLIKPNNIIRRKVYTRLYLDFFIMFIILLVCFTIISVTGGMIQLTFLYSMPVLLRYIFYIGIGFILVGILFLLYDIYVNLLSILKRK